MDHAIEQNTNGSGSGHEHREANLSLIVWSAVGLAVATVIIMALIWGMFNILKKTDETEAAEQQSSPLAIHGQLPPEPRLQVRPYEELQVLRAREDDVLSNYGWQDQKNGIVHIPIDKAMDIVAQRGPYGGKLEPQKNVKSGAPK
ncbi:MAG: hypothetical protein ACR2NN_11465 [Bryobacteraceae bacterium]